MAKTILLLGHSGKMGVALSKAFSHDHLVIGKNSKDFDAEYLDQVDSLIDSCSPDIIINTVAFLGIDSCELEPEKALRLNTVFPGHLAELASKRNIVLVHFSTDAVFNDEKHDFCTEDDTPAPLNLYGVTKYGGDCLISSICKRHYIFRIPILFGEYDRENQFVEKMLALLCSGQKTLRVSDDIISSPTYSRDVAERVRELLLNEAPFGTYHLANEGKASLYDLMAEIVSIVRPDNTVERASYRDFPFIGIKNTYTPLSSLRTKKLRHWREAVRDYCSSLRERG